MTLIRLVIAVSLCNVASGFSRIDAAAHAQVPSTSQPKGLMPNLGRPTRPDDTVPLLDFEKYFVGQWTFQADAPDSVLGPGGESTGTVTYRKLADGFFEAVTAGKNDTGAFTIRETIAYHREQRMAFRHVTDSRGYYTCRWLKSVGISAATTACSSRARRSWLTAGP